MTLRITISRTGVGPEKTGFVGALAGGHEPGVDERVEVEFDQEVDTIVVVHGVAASAASAFTSAFATTSDTPKPNSEGVY